MPSVLSLETFINSVFVRVIDSAFSNATLLKTTFVPIIQESIFKGDAEQLGQAHGERFRAEIQSLTEERMRLCHDGFWTGEGGAKPEPTALGKKCWEYQQRYDERTTAELVGIARAADVPASDLLVTGGFTDFVDVLRGRGTSSGQPVNDPGQCTAVLIAADAAADGQPLLAQTWDMHTSATPFIKVLDLRSTDQPAAVVFTVAGCPAMIGVNEYGLAVGINNMVTSDGRPGVMWTSVVRRILRSRNANEAVALLEEAPVAGAHHYLLLDSENVGYSVERSPTQFSARTLVTTLAHTNHCLTPDLKTIEPTRGAAPVYSSIHRLQSAEDWLVSNAHACSRKGIWQLLNRYDENDPLGSICHGPLPDYDVETGGAVVIAPRERSMDAVWGQANLASDTDRIAPQSFHALSQP
jgi:isopenicillin-N N-acyltransferase-like protein